METNDKLLKEFFSSQKQDIADNGFTQGVMRKIPKRDDKDWIVWFFACMGFLISLYMGINSGFIQLMIVSIRSISMTYVLIGVFCFPLVSTVWLYVNNRISIRFIS
jgi:hypothetical protein